MHQAELFEVKRILILGLIYLAGCCTLIISCTQEETRDTEAVVARIGSEIITTTEFKNSFESGPALLKELHRPRQSFLEAMINEELLASRLLLDSNYQDIASIDKAKRLLIQELLVERLFKEEVHGKVQVDSLEIIEEIKKSNRQIKAQILMFSDQTQANRYADQLSVGKGIETLHDPATEDPVILDTTNYLHHGEIPEPFNTLLFSLDEGAYSSPIQVGEQFLILQNAHTIQEILDENDFIRLRDRFNKVISYRKSLEASRIYIKVFMEPRQFRVNGNSFAFLVNALYDMFVNIPYQLEHGIIESHDPELGAESIRSEIELRGEEIAVMYAGGVFTLSELLDMLMLKPFRIASQDKESFATELRSEIGIALRDHFMAEEAKKRGYGDSVELLEEVSQWEQKLLVEAYIRDIQSQVTINDNSLKAYLKSSGMELPDSEARQNALRMQLITIETRRMLDRELEIIRADMPVVINEDVLLGIDVPLPTVKRQPDVHLFKLGLPYMRSAFPTPNPIWGTNFKQDEETQ